ncbi:MAG: hypothetical protein ACRCX2_38000 [Paraclostridium sp.]
MSNQCCYNCINFNIMESYCEYIECKTNPTSFPCGVYEYNNELFLDTINIGIKDGKSTITLTNNMMRLAKIYEDSYVKAKCIHNKGWFGTIGKEYNIIRLKEKEVNDICHTGHNFKYIAYEVMDDKGQKVDICSDMFYIE